MGISKNAFVLPFTAGTALGVFGGLVLGAVLGHRVATLMVHAWSVLIGDDDDEPRFELLLQ
ncbi:MAG TPA: hypothetical protein VFI42_17665 [Thermomicrobiaceae bacterium]|nr:hypothetical protein [Thermomicrobiaceae bacterium]